MKKIVFSLLFIIFFSSAQAKIRNDKINILTKKLYQNEMIIHRFFQYFLFIKNDIYKQKNKKELNSAINKFEKNLDDLIFFLPKSQKSLKNVLDFYESWNKYKLNITNYKTSDYDYLINKTFEFEDLFKDFKCIVLKNISLNRKLKRQIKKVVKNNKIFNYIVINYILKNEYNNKTASRFKGRINKMQRNLKKLLKTKKLKESLKNNYKDMFEKTINLEALLIRKTYHPKLMYAYAQSFSKRSALVIKELTENTSINN